MLYPTPVYAFPVKRNYSSHQCWIYKLYVLCMLWISCTR